jgi:putative addiction module component (TIGR02574 family)
MNISDIEAEALKLDMKSRARLAGKLLNSLESLSESEVTQLWIEEARRREAQMDAGPHSGVPAEDVFHEIRASLK